VSGTPQHHDDEPCMCGTPFTCMANEHDHVIADDATTRRAWATYTDATTRPPTAAPVGHRLPPAPDHRAPIGPNAVRAAYRAHRDTTHHGVVSTTCPACRSYLTGISRAAEQAAT
jgi:hypothetical protein